MLSVELADQFLVLRDNNLFRGSINDLSYLYATSAALDAFNATLNKLSALIDQCGSEDFLESNFYTKEQLKSTFTTKEEVKNLLENETYILTGDALKTINSLSTESQISAWRSSLFTTYQDVIRKAYAYTAEMWNASKRLAKNKEEGAQDAIGAYPHSQTESDANW